MAPFARARPNAATWLAPLALALALSTIACGSRPADSAGVSAIGADDAADDARSDGATPEDTTDPPDSNDPAHSDTSNPDDTAPDDDIHTPDTGPTDTEPSDAPPADIHTPDTGPTDTHPADIHTPDTEPTDIEPTDTEPTDTEPTDTADAPPTDVDPDAAWGDPCDPPLRMRPTLGSTTGGTLVEVAGSEFYIGALGWWMDLEDHVLGESSWVFGTPCTLYFVTQPAPPSTREAAVYYGGPEGPTRERMPVGTFTFVDDRAPVGRSSCRTDGDCGGTFEVCHAGLSACIVDRCTSASCGGGWLGGPCDALRGCVHPGECATDADCKLLYSSCSCVAVPRSDPRTTLDSCAYDGCAECAENSCGGDGVGARCEASVCVPRRRE